MLLNPRERFDEMMMMGLRLAEPISSQRIISETGRDLFDWLEERNVKRLALHELVRLDDASIASTKSRTTRLKRGAGKNTFQGFRKLNSRIRFVKIDAGISST